LDNWKTEGTHSYDTYEVYKYAGTIKEAKELGATSGDIRWAYERGRILFPEHENPMPGHYVKADYVAAAYAHDDHRVAAAMCNKSKPYSNRVTKICSLALACLANFNDSIGKLWSNDVVPEWVESQELTEAFALAEAYNLLVLGTNNELPSTYVECCETPQEFVCKTSSELSSHQVVALAKEINDGDHSRAKATDTDTFQKQGDLPTTAEADKAGTPRGYKTAMKSPFKIVWKKSMDKEYYDLEKLPAWTKVTQEEAAKHPKYNPRHVMRTTWVYRWKKDSNGEIYKAKSRLVLRGDQAVKGVHYNQTFCPTANINSIRVLVALAAAKGYNMSQLDFSQAFTMAAQPAHTPVWMYPPQGYESYYKDKYGNEKQHLLSLNRVLYGQPDAPLRWFELLSSHLQSELKFEKLASDNCTFVLKEGSSECIMSVYVDDCLVLDNDPKLRQKVMDSLGQRFTINTNESGSASWMLGVSIVRDEEAGTIKLSQETAIDQLVEKCGLTDSNPKATPMTDLLPTLDTPQLDSEHCINGLSFRSVIGSCLYISMVTRPDISFAVSHLARHAVTPGAAHVTALKRVVQYLKGTRTKGLVYGGNGTDTQLQFYEAGAHPSDLGYSGLTSYADADYAANYTRRSTSGYVLYMAGAPVSWRSTLQKVVAQSTAEAEIIAATDCAKEVIHARLMMKELGMPEVEKEPTTVYEDNRAAQLMCHNEKSNRGAKHFEIRLRFLQDCVSKFKSVKFVPIPTDEQIADIFTKPLASDKFIKFASKMVQ
jgi:hypothetical protein